MDDPVELEVKFVSRAVEEVSKESPEATVVGSLLEAALTDSFNELTKLIRHALAQFRERSL